MRGSSLSSKRPLPACKGLIDYPVNRLPIPTDRLIFAAAIIILMKKFYSILLVAVLMLPVFAGCGDDVLTPEDPQEIIEEPTPVDPYDLNAALMSHGPEAGLQTVSLARPVSTTPTGTTGLSWSSIGTSILTGCASGLGSFLVNRALTYACDAIFGEESQELLLLHDVMDKLNDVEERLDNLTSIAESIYEKLDETELNAIFSSFKSIDAQLASLSSVNDFYYSRLSKAGSEEEIKDIVREWGTTTINGNPAYSSVLTLSKSILDFTYSYNGAYVNFCSVYDMIVFDNVAWENLGYDYRDMFRAYAAANIAHGLYLTFAYYSLFEAESSLEQVVKTANRMANYFNSCPVIRDSEHVVCQIKGAHFRLPVDCLDEHRHSLAWPEWGKCALSSIDFLMYTQTDVMKIYPITHNNTISDEMYLYNVILSDAARKDEFLKSQLTNDEVMAIMNCYINSSEGGMSLFDILALAGVKVPESCQTMYVQTTPGEFKNVNEVYFGTSDTEIIGFHDNGDPWNTTNKGDCCRMSISGYFMAGLPVSATYKGTPVCKPCYEERYADQNVQWPFYFVVRDWGETKTVVRSLDGKTVSRKYARTFCSASNNPINTFPGDHFVMLKLGALERY